jgi:hypothetical protein
MGRPSAWNDGGDAGNLLGGLLKSGVEALITSNSRKRAQARPERQGKTKRKDVFASGPIKRNFLDQNGDGIPDVQQQGPAINPQVLYFALAAVVVLLVLKK